MIQVWKRVLTAQFIEFTHFFWLLLVGISDCECCRTLFERYHGTAKEGQRRRNEENGEQSIKDESETQSRNREQNIAFSSDAHWRFTFKVH